MLRKDVAKTPLESITKYLESKIPLNANKVEKGLKLVKLYRRKQQQKLQQKSQKQKIQELVKDAKRFESISREKLERMWVLDKDWIAGRREIYTSKNIENLSIFSIFQPLGGKQITNRVSWGTWNRGDQNPELMRERFYKTDDDNERIRFLKRETGLKYRRVYPDMYDSYNDDMKFYGEPLYGKIKSPKTKNYVTPVLFSNMYDDSSTGGYNGKFKLLLKMMKNKDKTIRKIANKC